MSLHLLGLAAWVGLSFPGATPADAPRAPIAPDLGSMPWANVTPENEAMATALRDQGNEEFYGGLTDAAAEHYREALRHWDHPAIHNNYAQALQKQFKLLECHEHLMAATRYGPAPLGDEEKYRRALEMLVKVEGELTRLEITCDEPGARVTVDDRQDPIECPRTSVQWMLPGPHALSIAKVGFVSRKKPVELSRGKRIAVHYEIFTEQQMKKTRTRWPWWLPWTVLGAGAATAAGGGVLHARAYNALLSYDDSIAHCAASPSEAGFEGCPPDLSQGFASQRSQGDTQQRAAWGLYLSGGGAVIAGAILLGVNLPESYTEDPDLDLRTVAVMPVVGPDLNGVRLSIAF